MDAAAVDRIIEARRAAAGSDAPARTRLYVQLMDAIRSGGLPAGAKLPSARRLAARWALPRGAVDDALTRLQSEGLIERRVGDGSYVAARAVAASAHPQPALPVDDSTRAVINRLTAWSAQARMFGSHRGGPRAEGAPTASAAAPEPARPRLRPGLPDLARFPLAAWRREVARALREEHRAALSYGMPAGAAELRGAIARHLMLTRALPCRAEQVLVLGSPRQGIELFSRVLLAPGELVCVEDPGPLSMTRRFTLAHLRVVGVAPDDEGFDVATAQAEAPQAAAIVLQPLHQWPLGVRTSAARRSRLLQWADATGAWIVELDSLGEIVHDGAAPPPLFCGDTSGRVLFLGNFHSLLFPGLRIAYLVLPEPLVDVFTTMRGLMGEHNSMQLQLALAGFIEDGHLASHVRAMRLLYRTRRDALVRAAQALLPAAARLGPVEGGIHACLHLPAACADAALAERLSTQGVGVQPLSRHLWRGEGLNGLLLGYGADDEDAIEAAIGVIGRLLRGG